MKMLLAAGGFFLVSSIFLTPPAYSGDFKICRGIFRDEPQRVDLFAPQVSSIIQLREVQIQAIESVVKGSPSLFSRIATRYSGGKVQSFFSNIDPQGFGEFRELLPKIQKWR